MKNLLVSIIVLTLVAPIAFADTVRIECIGTVEYSQVNQGIFAEVNAGDAVYATFTVDSETWVPSPGGYGVRGYPVDLTSFELTIGSVGPVPLVIPQPNGETTYFSLRDADPVSDGFFIANDIDWDYNLPKLDVPGGLDPYFSFHWTVGYSGDTFNSLDIMDAVGSYDYTGIESFYTSIADAWADPIFIDYTQTNIIAEPVAVETESFGSVKALYR